MVRLHPRPFAIAVFGASVYACATVASSFALGRVTDRVILPRFDQGHVDGGTVAAAIALVIGVGLVKAAGIITRRIAATITGARVGGTLRSMVVERYQLVPYEYHQRNPTGELLSHAGNDVDAATEVLAPLPFASGVMVILVVSFGWMLLTDPYFAAIAVVLFPTLVALNVVYQRRVERPAEEAQEQLGVVSAVAHESFDGALVVKALGAERLESERFRAASEKLLRAKVRVATTRATFDAVLDALPTIGIAVLLPVGAWRVESGAVTVGDVVAFVSLFTILVWPLRLIGYVLGELPRAVVGMDRIQEVLAEPIDPRHELTVSRDAASAASGRAALLDVQGLGFGYEPGRDVLDGVTFSVAPGRTVAVVGPTGSGKSTLLLLVAGLIGPQRGGVRVDGRDLSSFTVDDLRATVAMAFQEAFLFGDSLAENILLGDDDPELLATVADLAGVSGFARRLPQGFATLVGERGATLSGGQRQRVALARALARRPRLLLLDDATSAVDPTTEARILRSLRSHLTATTTLVVASRPSTIALADEVIFLDEGRVVDQGAHDELLARQPGYAHLVRAYELDRADRAGEVSVT
ncbi:MAG: ATP-binding cassette, subfamily bacterial [Acidimicrobiaceae bacterium]